MIPNTGTSFQALSTGVNTVYSYLNKIFQASDLAITAYDASSNPFPFIWMSGSTFACVSLGLTATVTGLGSDSGCSITLSAPLTAGWTLDTRSNVPDTQNTSIKNQGQFLPDLHETAFDRATRQTQDLKRLTYIYGLHGPDSEVTPWPALPVASLRQNCVVAFDGAGLPTVVPESALGGGGGTGTGGGVFTVASAPSIFVPADSAGNVTSFALANGNVNVYSGATNITANCSFLIAAQVNCTGTVNTAPNNPVVGGPLGYYAISAMTSDAATLTVRASFNGTNYDTVISFAKVRAGASGSPGAPGAAGPPGATGAPGSGTTALSIYLTNESMSVFAYADGEVPSFAGVAGQAVVLSGTVDVSEAATWTAVSANCTGSVNSADNVPVNGQPIGYYQITAMAGSTGTLTISAVYSGSTLTKVFTVTKILTGYEIVATLPTTFLFQGRMVFLTTDNKLYRYTGTAWTPAVAATDVTGQLTASQIASIATAQLTGQIASTQISNGAISTPLLAAGAVTSANIAAGTIVAGNIATGSITAALIAAGTITAAKIASGTITTNLIQTGAITAALISVTSLSSMSANIGTVNAGVIQNAGGTTVLNLNTGTMLFNNGVYMHVVGSGFGSANQFIDWYGPFFASFASCTEANALMYLKTNGTAFFFGQTKAAVCRSYNVGVGLTETAPANIVQVVAEVWGAPGGGGSQSGSSSKCGGSGASGGYARTTHACSGGQTFTFTVGIGGAFTPAAAGDNGTASSISSSLFATMTANGGAGGGVGTNGTQGAAGTPAGTASGGVDVNTTGKVGLIGSGTIGAAIVQGGDSIVGNNYGGIKGGYGGNGGSFGVSEATAGSGNGLVVFTYI